MNKPVSIASYEGDTLMLKVALYDEQNNPFDTEAYKIEEAKMRIGKVDTEFSGSIDKNCVAFVIERGVLNEIGNFPFAVKIFGKEGRTQFTVLTGIITVQPEISPEYK